MTTLPLPVYSIYDHDIPLVHLRAGCIIINPIAASDKIYDSRDAHDKHVPSCEGDRCTLPQKVVSNGTAK